MLAALGLLALALVARADLTIYADGTLSSGWENWSWGSNLTFASTDVAGATSLGVVSAAYSALSLKLEGTFSTYAGLKFQIAGAQPDVTLSLASTADNGASPNVPLSALSTSVSSNNFTTVVVNFGALPPTGSVLANDTWDRITWQSGGNGAVYYLNNVVLLTEIVITPKFLGAEPLAANVIAVTTQGAVDFSTVSVKLNNATVAVKSTSTYSPPDTPSQTITYLTLAKAFAAGSLAITAGSLSFSYTLPAVQYAAVTTGNKNAISPSIYGINFIADANTLTTLGVTVNRWGGNAVTAYNPNGQFTNAGNDWYFENRVASPPDADAWVGWNAAAGANTIVAIPSLDWVAKDGTSYSYPKSTYPNSTAYDPYNANAGNGQLANGSFVSPPPPQTNAYTPWNTSLAAAWLAGLAHKPTVVTVDNEIEIASSTHQDMHPNPIGYDEELARVIATATMAKNTLPNVKVAAPSTCAWWFYWTSSIGYTDNAAHNNIDFLPWFLAQMKKAETTAGKRLLDFLDIHYYYGADTSANDAAAKALRMRITRSLWDPSYVDESYIGTSAPQNHQPNPTAVWLIPRMKALIAQNYPGTKLSISEWAIPQDTSDPTAAIAAADVLGIYGREGVDQATYWGTIGAKDPIGLAFWLYRGNGVVFPPYSAQVSLAAPANASANVLGVYAGTDAAAKKVSLVLVNKDVKPVALALSNVPAGTYFMRHIGGASGMAKWQTTVTLGGYPNYVVVPAYASVFLQQQ